jgi:hypothetical protein
MRASSSPFVSQSQTPQDPPAHSLLSAQICAPPNVVVGQAPPTSAWQEKVPPRKLVEAASTLSGSKQHAFPPLQFAAPLHMMAIPVAQAVAFG